jgi:hypothetical protein
MPGLASFPKPFAQPVGNSQFCGIANNFANNTLQRRNLQRQSGFFRHGSFLVGQDVKRLLCRQSFAAWRGTDTSSKSFYPKIG